MYIELLLTANYVLHKDLNKILTEFYHRDATFISAEQWMGQNEYDLSVPEDDVGSWMCK